VADEVDLVGARDGQDGVDLLQQLLATHLGRIHRRDLGRVDPGAMRLQVSRDAVPIVDADHRVPAQQAVGQHDRVLGGGVGVGGCGRGSSADECGKRHGAEEGSVHVQGLLLLSGLWPRLAAAPS
jgi:hypothetical protein